MIKMFDFIDLGENIFIAKEKPKRVNVLNSLVMLDDHRGRAILIDANYPFDHIDALYEKIPSPAKALLFSHCHLDHTAHGFYHQQKYNTPLFCPIQEKDHILSLKTLMEDVGFIDLGLEDLYRMMVEQYMKFEECDSVLTFTPGKDVLEYDRFLIQTIHVPGHSPGHTAFIIKSLANDTNRKVLYVSDIGSHPYYGDNYSDLLLYRQSIDMLEKIYLADDFILVPAHGTVYEERNPQFFEKIRKRIQKNADNVLDALRKKEPKTIRAMVFEGVITPKSRQNSLIKNLYLLWDGGMIHQHLQEFMARGLVKNLDNESFLTDRYILV